MSLSSVGDRVRQRQTLVGMGVPLVACQWPSHRGAQKRSASRSRSHPRPRRRGDRMIGRRRALVAAASIAVGTTSARAQTRRLPRLGILAPERPPFAAYNVLLQALRALGQIEGETYALETHWAGGSEFGSLPTICERAAREECRRHPDRRHTRHHRSRTDNAHHPDRHGLPRRRRSHRTRSRPEFGAAGRKCDRHFFANECAVGQTSRAAQRIAAIRAARRRAPRKNGNLTQTELALMTSPPEHWHSRLAGSRSMAQTNSRHPSLRPGIGAPTLCCSSRARFLPQRGKVGCHRASAPLAGAQR